jgi:hypothetical protein
MVKGKRCGRGQSVVDSVNMLSQYSHRRTDGSDENLEIAGVQSK